MKKPKFENISEANDSVINEYIAFRQGIGKSKDTVITERETLKRFADFLQDKEFKHATKLDMENFFSKPMFKDKKETKQISQASKDLYAIHLKVFYRKLLNLKRRKIPDILEWYEPQTKKSKEQQQDVDELQKYLISPETYQKIQDNSFDGFGMYKAMWETFSLSGGRLGEIQSMKIKHVITDTNGNTTVKLPTSKSKPRPVYLEEPAKNLERWIHNHPLRNEPNFQECPLWISLSNHNRFGQLGPDAISRKLEKITKIAGIDQQLTPHCFRKTRATKMFNQRSKDGGLIYTDKDIGMYFGWSIQTVARRREEYDLNSHEDLKELIFNGTTGLKESFDTVVAERDALNQKQQTQIEKQNERITELENTLHFAQQNAIDTEKGSSKVITELQNQIAMLTEQFKILEKRK